MPEFVRRYAMYQLGISSFHVILPLMLLRAYKPAPPFHLPKSQLLLCVGRIHHVSGHIIPSRRCLLTNIKPNLGLRATHRSRGPQRVL